MGCCSIRRTILKRCKRRGVTCSTGFFLILAALIYLDGQGVVLRALLAAALHEGGHWAAIILLGGRVRVLRLGAVGAEMELDASYPLSYTKEAAAAFAGPAVNLLLAAFSIQMRWYLFAGLNLSLGLLNLLPVRMLDGGRILSCVLCVFSPERAQRIVNALSALLAGAVLGVGWAAWRQWGNLTLLCVAAWLTAGVLKS